MEGGKGERVLLASVLVILPRGIIYIPYKNEDAQSTIVREDGVREVCVCGL